MDELTFRSSQKIENIQLQAQLAAAKTKDAIVLYSQQVKVFILELLKSTKAEQLQANIKELVDKFVNNTRQLKAIVLYYSNPQRIYQGFIKIFGKRWSKRDIYFGCTGLLIGIIVGIYIGLSLRRREPVVQYMRAVQCKYYSGCESVTVVEDAIAPFECGEFDVLVNVKAASIQSIDIQICNGYGKTLRKFLQKIYKKSQTDLPVILGRDCTGIITDVGCKVKRLEVGDEIWLAVPFWLQGTLCQTLLVSENYVSRKPKNVGFEGASSIPYAGSLALSALGEANVISSNAYNKKILVHGGCTPVGCILIQLLKYWNATITTTCYRKAIPIAKALGASDVIIVSEQTDNKSELETVEVSDMPPNILLKELELRGEIYDVIIKTTDLYDDDNLSKYCKHNSAIISTLPPLLSSDSYGFLRKFMYFLYLKLKYKLQAILGLPINDFEETHLCYVTLDRLTEFVEDGHLQTVVDKVFVPEDIELAISHIQNPLSIGSTIVTFR